MYDTDLLDQEIARVEAEDAAVKPVKQDELVDEQHERLVGVVLPEPTKVRVAYNVNEYKRGDILLVVDNEQARKYIAQGVFEVLS